MVARARKLFRAVRSEGVKILGPAAAPLARLRREYRFQFVLKSPQRAALGKSPQRLPRFLRRQGNSGNRRNRGRGPGLVVVTLAETRSPSF